MATQRSKRSDDGARRLRRGIREEARERLRSSGLRVTSPRLEVLLCLTARNQAMTHSEVVELLGETTIDAATIYRNLVKLSEHGVVEVVSRAGGMARYVVSNQAVVDHKKHLHFLCTECGTVSCLPEDVVSSIEAKGRWRDAVASAQLQLEGLCPDCRQGDAVVQR